LYFWFDPKVPKDQGWIKIPCFLRGGLFTRYKPLQRTGLRLLLYRLLKACTTILPLKTGEIFIRPQSQNVRLPVLFTQCHGTMRQPTGDAGDSKRHFSHGNVGTECGASRRTLYPHPQKTINVISIPIYRKRNLIFYDIDFCIGSRFLKLILEMLQHKSKS
jgi:hypothetical protein